RTPDPCSRAFACRARVPRVCRRPYEASAAAAVGHAPPGAPGGSSPTLPHNAEPHTGQPKRGRIRYSALVRGPADDRRPDRGPGRPELRPRAGAGGSPLALVGAVPLGRRCESALRRARVAPLGFSGQKLGALELGNTSSDEKTKPNLKIGIDVHQPCRNN